MLHFALDDFLVEHNLTDLHPYFAPFQMYYLNPSRATLATLPQAKKKFIDYCDTHVTHHHLSRVISAFLFYWLSYDEKGFRALSNDQELLLPLIAGCEFHSFSIGLKHFKFEGVKYNAKNIKNKALPVCSMYSLGVNNNRFIARKRDTKTFNLFTDTMSITDFTFDKFNARTIFSCLGAIEDEQEQNDFIRLLNQEQIIYLADHFVGTTLKPNPNSIAKKPQILLMKGSADNTNVHRLWANAFRVLDSFENPPYPALMKYYDTLINKQETSITGRPYVSLSTLEIRDFFKEIGAMELSDIAKGMHQIYHAIENIEPNEQEALFQEFSEAIAIVRGYEFNELLVSARQQDRAFLLEKLI